MDGETTHLFELVNAAHRFLLNYPWTGDTSWSTALAGLLTVAASPRVPAASLDAVLFRVLRVLDRHGNQGPSLAAHYLDVTRDNPGCVAAFQACVEQCLPLPGIRDRRMRDAIAVIEQSYSDPTLTLSTIASRVGLSAPRLAVRFRHATSATVMRFLREVRLRHAATGLGAGAATIKEVWTAVGYNHASNFDHDFLRRFGVSPREFRASGILPVMSLAGPPDYPASGSLVRRGGEKGRRVLIVEDDLGMRETYATYLERDGYIVASTDAGEAGLCEARRRAPDIVLLDYWLPDMTGVEFLREFRKAAATNQTPVVLFTADWSVQTYAQDIQALGAVIRSKLCDIEDMGRVIRALAS
jgi:AraC-like DNA-binding protein